MSLYPRARDRPFLDSFGALSPLCPSASYFQQTRVSRHECGSKCMASLRPEIESCGVSDNLISGRITLRSSLSRNRTYPVIPERNLIRLPVEAHLEVNILGDLVEQDIEHDVGLRFWDTDYATGRARVNIDALPAS